MAEKTTLKTKAESATDAEEKKTASKPLPGFLRKPTQDTRYHIDYGWWDKSNVITLTMVGGIRVTKTCEAIC